MCNDYVTVVEHELLVVSRFEPLEVYRLDRQQYLRGLAKAAFNDTSNEEWENLSEAAGDWVNDAASAVKAGRAIRDFTDEPYEPKPEPPEPEKQPESEREPETYGLYTVHPVPALFPLIEGDEFDKLVEDIKTNSLREPIVLTHDGKQIADGRNRYRACERAGVEPRFTKLDALVPVTEFVISKNLRRRHLDAGQRAMVATKMLPHLEQEAKARQANTQFGTKTQQNTVPPKLGGPHGEAVKQAAKLADVSHGYVSQAKKVAEVRPDLAEQVAAGQVSLNRAYKETKGEPVKPRQTASAKAGQIEALKSQVKSLEHSLRSAETAVTIRQTGLSPADAKLLEEAKIIRKAIGSEWAKLLSDAKQALG